MVLSAVFGQSVAPLLLEVDHRLAGLTALQLAVALAAVAALANEEALVTPSAEELKPGFVVALAAELTVHVRSADGRNLDERRTTWQ